MYFLFLVDAGFQSYYHKQIMAYIDCCVKRDRAGRGYDTSRKINTKKLDDNIQVFDSFGVLEAHCISSSITSFLIENRAERSYGIIATASISTSISFVTSAA